MSEYCTQCGEERIENDNFCRACGYDFRQRNLPALQEQTQLTSFDPLRKLAEEIYEQGGWVSQDTVLEPLQKIVDNLKLRTQMEQATDIQIEQILAGYQDYTTEQVEAVIDQVRRPRRMGDAEVSLEIKRRDLELEDVIAERDHQRRLERLREEHLHEQKMMELRAQLELVNAIIQSFNQLKMIRLEAEAEGIADLEQMKMLTQVIRHSFTALAEIDDSLLAYKDRFDQLESEDLDELRPDELIEDLVEQLYDRVGKGAFQFGRQSRD
jgi:hypothetical protein